MYENFLLVNLHSSNTKSLQFKMLDTTLKNLIEDIDNISDSWWTIKFGI